MKSKKEILESGIIEQYVLGLTNEEENAKVLQYLEQYPELREHIQSIEGALETIAKENAIVPPEELRAATMKRIEEAEKLNFYASQKWKWLSLGAVAVGLLVFIWAYQLSQDLSTSRKKIAGIHEELDQLTLDCNQVNIKNQQYKRLIALYQDEFVRPVRLSGNEQLPGAEIIVLWGNKDQKSYVHIENLSPPPHGHIYQIWADVEGEMLPLGIFSNDKSLVDIEYLENAESLNVTIEEEGGSDHPNVAKLIMSQKV